MKGQQNQGRSGRFRLGILPVLIWVLALGATTALFWERAAGYEWVGIAGGQVYQLAAPISPTATTKLPAMVLMTIATTTVMMMSDWTNDLEYDRPLCVK